MVQLFAVQQYSCERYKGSGRVTGDLLVRAFDAKPIIKKKLTPKVCETPTFAAVFKARASDARGPGYSAGK
jgi:hypothetical protein